MRMRFDARTVERLLAQGYLDDVAFAQYWRENRDRFRPRSAAALRAELRQKGVDRAAVDEALDGLDEEAAAWTAVASKLSRWQILPAPERNQQITGFLARRGFSYAIIRTICRRADTHGDEASQADYD